jgi:hypothetical protein
LAYESPSFYTTLPASTGLKQYQFVTLNSNGRLANPSTEGNVIGILTSSGTTGSTGRAGSTDSGSVQTVQLLGIGKVIAGTTTIDIADKLKADTDGRASTASSTSYLSALALEAVDSTSTSAQIISVLLSPLSAWA